MSGLTDYINDRISRFIRKSDILNTTPAVVFEVEDDNWAKVSILSNGSIYRLKNLSGTPLVDGQDCQVYYKKSLSQSTAYIGAAIPRAQAGTINYLETQNLTGVRSGDKYKISEIKFVCPQDEKCFFSFSSTILGTESNNITLYLYIDNVEQSRTFSQTLAESNTENISFYLPLGELTKGKHTIFVKGSGSCNIQNVAAFVYGYDISEPEEDPPIFSMVGNSPNLPMSAGVGTADVPSDGTDSTPFVAHRKYYESADSGMAVNVSNRSDEIFGNYIEVQHYGGIYHDISELTEWSAKIKIGGLMSYSTPNRGYDLINSFENYNMHIFYEDYWGEKIYIIPQDMVASPVVYDNPFGFQAFEDDRLRMTTVPSGYSTIEQWFQNFVTDSHGSNVSQGREFWLGVKDGYLYIYLEGYPICKQTYSKPISKLNIGWLDMRSGNDYYSASDIRTFEIYDSFIFDIPAE